MVRTFTNASNAIGLKRIRTFDKRKPLELQYPATKPYEAATASYMQSAREALQEIGNEESPSSGDEAELLHAPPGYLRTQPVAFRSTNL